MPGPLQGIRILELGRLDGTPDTATAWACQILGDMGADIIKVEPPMSGQIPDPSRFTLNRNKRSLTLDITKKLSRDILHKLIAGMDVLVHANTRYSMADAGLLYPALKAANAGLVACAAPGYGQGGPYADRAASEVTMQAASGMAALNAQALARTPCYTPTLICDKTAALTIVSAVIAALFHRHGSGRGQEIEVPAFETMTAYFMIEHMWGESFMPPVAAPGYPGVLSPHRKLTPTKDGYISILTYMHWETFCRIGGREELIDDPRFKTLPDRMKHIDALYDETAKTMATRTTQEWLTAFGETSMPITAVNGLADLLDDPHLLATGFWKTMTDKTEGKVRLPAFPVNYAVTPADIRRLPPRPGEHTDEILREVG